MFDLHCHSKASDGLATFDTVVRRFAERSDLEILALTDHDAIEASIRLAAIEPRAWIGAEMTTRHNGRTVDLLALHVRPDCTELNDHLAARKRDRVSRFDAYGVALRDLGWQFAPPPETYDEPQLAKPHIVAEIRRHAANLARFVTLGIPLVVSDRSDNEDVYRLILDDIKVDAGYAVISTVDAIALIHRAGGIAVVAHPWIAPYDFGKTAATARTAIAEWAAADLDGLEVFHEAQTDPAIQAELLDLANTHDLLVTIGCDDHTDDLRNLGGLGPVGEDDRVAGWLDAILGRASARRR